MGLHARLTGTPPLPHNWFNMPANHPTTLFVRTITFCLPLILAAPVMADVHTAGTLSAQDGFMPSPDGINRPVGQDELVLLPPTYGQTLRATDKATIVELSDVNLPVKAGLDLTGKAADPIPGDPRRPI